MLTIKGLAQYIGISATTVSVVLRGEAADRRISQETQDKIWAAARELGYQPNLSARSLRIKPENRSLMVAVFWASDFRASMMARFLQGLKQALLDTSVKCEFIVHPYESGLLCESATLERINLCNAAIICNASARDMDFLERNNFAVPMVLYNRYSEKYCSVNVSDIDIGSIPAKVFAARGRKRTAVLNAASVFPGMDVRVSSFLSTGASLGLSSVGVFNCENSMSGGAEGARLLLRQSALPDCLFCASDAIAIGAVNSFHKANVRIPHTLEIISVGNSEQEQAEYCYPSLSVMFIPMENMAEQCLKLLLDVVGNRVRPPYFLEMPVVYIARESCGEAK